MNTSLPRITSLIEQLLSTPSISCTNKAIDQGNLPVITRLADWFEAMGFHCEIQYVDEAAGKANLIATAGEGNNGLVLAGHTDTVPCNEERWQVDPFAMTERDDRLYGLGSCDMKSFFAVILEALKDIDVEKFQQPLIIIATADEETSMAGAKAVARDQSRLGINNARYAIIGEPTGMRPIRMHKGIMMEAIKLTGQAGHSSNPSLGNNALEAMYKVIGELMRWRDELQSKHHNPMFEVPVPTMNFGHIHGGDNPNRICGQCELQIDIRPVPGMKLADLRAEMQKRLHDVLRESGISIETVELFDGIEAVETSKESDLVKLAEKMTNTDAEAVAFGTEAPYYNAMGMESIVMGPGSIDQAHQPDEYLEIKALDPAVSLLRQFIVHHCY